MSDTPLDNDPRPPEAGSEGAGHLTPPPAISYRKIAWPVALSLLSLVIVGALTDFSLSAFIKLLEGLNPWLLSAAIGTVVLRVVLGGERLRYVSRGRLSFVAGIRGQLAWDFFSNITPSAIGGGPVAIFYVARDEDIPVGEATAILLFSMLLDQLWFAITIPVLLLLSPWLQIFPASLGTVGTGAFVAVFTAMLAWVVLFGYAVLFRLDLLQRLADRILRVRWLRRFQERVNREMLQMRSRARVLRSQPPAFFAKGLLLTGAAWISRYLLAVFIVWSVYPEVDKLLLFLRTAAMSLGNIVMPTPGGAGGLEGLYAIFLGPLMPRPLVAPTLLMWRVLGFYLFLIVGVYLSMHQVQKTIRRQREEAASDGRLPSTQQPNGAEKTEVMNHRK